LYLMTDVFCQQQPLPNIGPAVGITDFGPHFIGAVDVKLLFDALFSTFNNLVLLPQISEIGQIPVISSQRLYSPEGVEPSTIGVQTVLAGTHVKPWFDSTSPHYSPPLSNIRHDKVHKMEIPAFAVFSFDDDNKITSLQIYLDRYKMQQQLTPATPSTQAR